MPKAPLTKAQALTVLVRAMDGKKDESGTPRWKNYFNYAQDNRLTKETDVYAVDKPLSRYESLLMQYRAKSDDCTDNTVGYSVELLDILQELFGDSGTPTVDLEPTDDTPQVGTGDVIDTGSLSTGNSMSGDLGTGQN
ncbi:MAG: hypothetical protein H6765_04310 [Candidatus Peribacteria bacterium]|nr:MAG: hypothetical protein H6765_04310 [Candidatus Peribacteria bacterium]